MPKHQHKMPFHEVTSASSQAVTPGDTPHPNLRNTLRGHSQHLSETQASEKPVCTARPPVAEPSTSA